jgi:hypothetical protein
MFSFSGYSQSQVEKSIEINSTETNLNMKLENTKATSSIEFALWFMGTKQDPKTTLSTESTSAKKSIITSGMAPNRLLIKAFLKKVVNYESSLS